jgi:hypothetical protein
LLNQKRSGSGGINSTAHANNHASTLFRIHRATVYAKRSKSQVLKKG